VRNRGETRVAGRARAGYLDREFTFDVVLAVACLALLNLAEVTLFDLPGLALRGTGVPVRSVFHPTTPVLIYLIPGALGGWCGLRLGWRVVPHVAVAAVAFLVFQHWFPGVTWRVGVGFGVSDGSSVANDVGTLLAAWTGAMAGAYVAARRGRGGGPAWRDVPRALLYAVGLASVAAGLAERAVPLDVPPEIVGYTRAPHGYFTALIGVTLTGIALFRSSRARREA